jgi:TonB-dependent receptor
MRTYTLNLQILLCLLFIVVHANAQQGKGVLQGKVTETDVSYVLPGASIWIEGTSNGTTSNVEGEYRLANIPTGKHKIHFRYIGFAEKIIEVNIDAQKTQTVNVQLESSSIQGDEVLVTTQFRGQTQAINQQLNSNSIVNIVSEEKIKELPDVNAAEAIGRLPSVAVQRSGGEGQKVMIRGLEPKYSMITVNGVRVPSSSGNDKSVDLTMISSDLLSGIELYKSPTPDMDAEAVGGTVNLIIKKAPENFRTRISAQGAYNALNNDYTNYQNSFQIGKRFFKSKLGVILSGNMEKTNRGSEGMSAGYRVITEGGTDRLGGTSISLNDHNVIRKRLGGSINIDYALSKDHSITSYLFTSSTSSKSNNRSIRFDPFWNNSIDYSINLGESSLSLFSASFNGVHKFSFLEADWGVSTSKTTSDNPMDFTMNFEEKGAFMNGQVSPFDHPNSFLTANSLDSDFSTAYLYDNYFNPGDNDEKNFTSLVNFKFPFMLGDKISGFFKFGGKYNQLKHAYNSYSLAQKNLYLGSAEMQTAISSFPNQLSLAPNGKISMANFINQGESIANFLGEENYIFSPILSEGVTNQWYEAQKSNLQNDRSATSGNLYAIETVSAAYVMAKIEIGKMLSIIPGVRFERSDNEYTGKYSTLDGRYGETGMIKDTTHTQSYNEILPHFHFKFKPFDWIDLRGAVVKTIARPNI